LGIGVAILSQADYCILLVAQPTASKHWGDSAPDWGQHAAKIGQAVQFFLHRLSGTTAIPAQFLTFKF